MEISQIKEGWRMGKMYIQRFVHTRTYLQLWLYYCVHKCQSTTPRLDGEHSPWRAVSVVPITYFKDRRVKITTWDTGRIMERRIYRVIQYLLCLERNKSFTSLDCTWLISNSSRRSSENHDTYNDNVRQKSCGISMFVWIWHKLHVRVWIFIADVPNHQFTRLDHN